MRVSRWAGAMPIPIAVVIAIASCSKGATESKDSHMGTWALTSPIPNMFVATSAAEANGIIYVAGVGTDSVSTVMEAYDPSTDSWTAKTPAAHRRRSFGFASVNGKLYAIGGDTGAISRSSAAVEVYDPATDSWTTKTSMPVPGNPRVVALNGTIYAAGSSNSPVFQAYDVAADAWSTKAPMPVAYVTNALTESGGIIYEVAGFDTLLTGDTVLTRTISIQAYDPGSNTWSEKRRYTAHGGSVGAGTLSNIVYVVGGNNARTLLAYDPASDTWEIRTPMHYGRSGLQVVTVGGRLYAISGEDSTFSTTTAASVEAYTP